MVMVMGRMRGIHASEIAATASDNSSISAIAAAGSVAVAKGQTSVALSIGVTIAENTITNELASYLANVEVVRTSGGKIAIASTDQSTIKVVGVAAAVSLAFGDKGIAISGGGVGALNIILTTNNAYIKDSNVGASDARVGIVDLDASSTSTIDALVLGLSASVGGGSTGVGVAIGISVARNFIGWDPYGTRVTPDHVWTDKPTRLTKGDHVSVTSGPLAGQVFEYLGETRVSESDKTIDLSIETYYDSTVWKQSSLKASAAEVQARILDSSIEASGALTVDALSKQSIDAKVIAVSVAISGGANTGVGVSGAGVYAENRMSSLVTASIQGDGSSGITAASVSLNAEEQAAIGSFAAAPSLAASFSSKSVAVAIGISLAFNEIDNAVSAFIANADGKVSTLSAGDISVTGSFIAGQNLRKALRQ